MEYLQNFNEHQKRKFKSYQTEKQAEMDKKEEEERRKSYTGYGYGGGEYHRGRDYWDNYYDDYTRTTTSTPVSNLKKTIYSSMQGGEWSSPSTWVHNIVPQIGDNVVIDSVVVLDNKSTSYRTCNSLIVNGGKRFTISSGTVLNITTTVTNRGTIVLDSGSTTSDGRAHYTTLIINGEYTSEFGATIKQGKFTILKTKFQTLTKRGSDTPEATSPNSIKPSAAITPAEKKFLSEEEKVIKEHEQALYDLIPGLDFNKLPLAAFCISYSQVGLTCNKDYEIIPTTQSNASIRTGHISPTGVNNMIKIRNDNGIEISYYSMWFREYKMFKFKVYATPETSTADVVTPSGILTNKGMFNITKGKNYRLLGQNDKGYEIIDDKGVRKNYLKTMFSLPFLIDPDTNIKMISRTQVCKNTTPPKSSNEPPPIPPYIKAGLEKTIKPGQVLGKPLTSPPKSTGIDTGGFRTFEDPD